MAKRERREVASAHMEKIGYSAWSVLLLWVLFGGTVGYVLFFSFFLAVEDTRIDGTEKISQESITRLVEEELSGRRFKIWPRNNFFSVRPGHIEELLREAHPLLKKVIVTRIFPNGLQVAIEERNKIVVWCSGGMCYLLNEEGVLMENRNITNEENKEYTITVSDMSNQSVLPGQRISEDGSLGAFIVSVGPALRERLGIETDEEYTTASRFADELRVTTKEGWELYLNVTTPIDSSLDDLKLLFDKELTAEKRSQLTYIDLRVENRAYYVLKNGEAVTVTGETVLDSTKNVDAAKITEKEKKKKK